MRKDISNQLRLIGVTAGVLFVGWLLWIVVVGPIILLLSHSR